MIRKALGWLVTYAAVASWQNNWNLTFVNRVLGGGR